VANLIRRRRDATGKGENNEQCNNVVQGNKLSRPLRLIVFAFRCDLLTPRHISALWTSRSLFVWPSFVAAGGGGRKKNKANATTLCKGGTLPAFAAYRLVTLYTEQATLLSGL
jgi:hypothetical protein